MRKWELENYLLQAKAIQQWLKDKLCSPDEPDFNADNLLAHEEDFIHLSCASTLAVSNVKGSPSEQFGRDKKGGDLRKTIVEHLSSSDEEFDSHRDRILAFAESEGQVEERWDKLSRMLDGKRILFRLSDRLNKEYPKRNLTLFGDRAFLAGYIANNDSVDPELVRTINQFAEGV